MNIINRDSYGVRTAWITESCHILSSKERLEALKPELVKPDLLAVLVFGKRPEWLILLDFIGTDNTHYARIFSSSFDVEDPVFGLFDQSCPLFSDPLGSTVQPYNLSSRNQ